MQTEIKVLIFVLSLVAFVAIFVSSLIFADSRLQSEAKMIAFEKCLANNLEMQANNKSTFSAHTNLCRL